MKIITINLSEHHCKALQVLQDLGLYPSRSEAIRVAIRDFLQRELGYTQKIDDIDPKPDTTPVTVEGKKKEIARLLRKLRDEQPGLTTVA